jgi:polyhydroxyalkanoate synthesis repressor PhaR
MRGADHDPGARVIKRYENRKLYDSSTRRYVTLDALAEMVAAGEDLHVVDRSSGEDLTTSVLAQVVFERVKQRGASIPRHILARLIRLQATPPEWTVPGQQTAALARTEAERIVGGLIKRGRIGLEDALSLQKEITESIHTAATAAQHGVERRLRALLESDGTEASVHPAIQRLKEKLLAFETYLGDAPAALPGQSKRGASITGRRPRARPKDRTRHQSREKKSGG